MSEKRFELIEDDLEPLILDNGETMSVNGVVDLLNEQQAEIERLKELERKIDRQESLINIILNNLPIHQAADIQKFVAESLKEWDS